MGNEKYLPADPRPMEQIREQYLLEKDLASRLLNSTRAERAELYTEVYEELFNRIPHHPQLHKKQDGRLQREQIANQARLLRRFLRPGETYLEVGAGDCQLACEMASRAGKVFAIEVSETISQRDDLPANVQVVITDGVTLDVPDRSIDVVFSNHVLEHMHPADAPEHMRDIHRVLKPGGRYLCVTPNQVSGPYDVSARFDEVATGFHLKEYTLADLASLFHEAGFRSVHPVARLGGSWRVLPTLPVKVVEWGVGRMKRQTRLKLSHAIRPRLLRNLRVLGIK